MLQIKKKANSQFMPEEEHRIRVLTRLEKLEKEILTLKGKERSRAEETYRELLWVLKDEPIYLARY